MNIRIALVSLGIVFAVASLSDVDAQSEPKVLGKGLERFEIGKMLHRDGFEELENWVVQVEEREGFPPARIEAKDQTLDCLLPGRGCTIWFNKKLKNRLAITYDVICPEPKKGSRGLQPKDVNNFWLASDPVDPEKGLFDLSRYNGGFNSYRKMDGYYASTGGGRNTTTRMRRYPREKDGTSTDHIALMDRDKNPEFMITPGKLMKVQLVAFDDLVQYIVDGELVYEMAFGDAVTVEQLKRGKKHLENDTYDANRFPFYQEGFFGFRMVGTHHVYSNFRVHELKPITLPEGRSE